VQGRWTEHRPADVNGYLAELGRLGRLGRLEDWRFRQAVEAIRKLLELVGVSWPPEVDWPYWLESALSLAADHPTSARSPSFRKGATAVVDQVSPARPGGGGGAALVLERLVAVIHRHDLHARAQPRWPGGAESVGRLVARPPLSVQQTAGAGALFLRLGVLAVAKNRGKMAKKGRVYRGEEIPISSRPGPRPGFVSPAIREPSRWRNIWRGTDLT